MEHCQICEREIKSKLGLIAHHGYQRPEEGWQTDSCMGARNLPYEVSRNVIPRVIKFLQVRIKNIEDKIREIKEKNLPIPSPFNSVFKSYKDIESINPQYELRRGEYIERLGSQIRRIKIEIERLQKRYDSWKIQTEIKQLEESQ